MKKQCVLPLVSAVSICLSLNAFAGDLTSLHFEQGLLKTQAKSGTLMGYLSKGGSRLTPDSCKVTLGQDIATTQVAANGCMVTFDGQGYAQVQAEIGEERAVFVVLSAKSSGYEFENHTLELSFGEEATNQLLFEGDAFSPATCEAVQNDAGITGSVSGGCYFIAGDVEASDTVIAYGYDGEMLDAFSVEIKGDSGIYEFRDPVQIIKKTEDIFNPLRFNGNPYAPAYCLTDTPETVAASVQGSGCIARGLSEGAGRVIAYNDKIEALSSYIVAVEKEEGLPECEDPTGECINIIDTTHANGTGKLYTNTPSQPYLDSVGGSANGGVHYEDYYSGHPGYFYRFTYDQAIMLCNKYNDMKLAGRGNWSLPSIQELRYLMDNHKKYVMEHWAVTLFTRTYENIYGSNDYHTLVELKSWFVASKHDDAAAYVTCVSDPE